MRLRLSLALSLLVLAALACQVGGNAAPSAASAPTPAVEAPVLPEAGSVVEDQDVLVALFENVSPGVVAIKTVGEQAGSLGSGFVYDDRGRIVTNYHVVEGSSEVEVDFVTGFKAYGTVIGTDLDSDLAVVEVDAPASELHPLALGDSDALKVGQSVAAIGNPFGLDSTMTLGIVSALGRTLDSIHAAPGGGFFTAGDIIQTDAAINPGNSGGPLFNMDGEVVGVNRAIRTDSTSVTGDPLNSGISFAVSSNIVRRVVPVLITDGKYDYPYLGMSSLDELSLPVIEALGLKTFTGAYVTSVTPGGPADAAGLKGGTEASSVGIPAGGDMITAIDGRPIKTFDELLSYLVTNKAPGDTVVLTVMRGEETVEITITLGRRP
ncbi:MAG: trypsin-like peptidase domain-containing protein [Chloroflexota bacterium]